MGYYVTWEIELEFDCSSDAEVIGCLQDIRDHVLSGKRSGYILRTDDISAMIKNITSGDCTGYDAIIDLIDILGFSIGVEQENEEEGTFYLYYHGTEKASIELEVLEHLAPLVEDYGVVKCHGEDAGDHFGLAFDEGKARGIVGVLEWY